MKTLKKIMALVMALSMVMVMTNAVFAAPLALGHGETGQITGSNGTFSNDGKATSDLKLNYTGVALPETYFIDIAFTDMTYTFVASSITWDNNSNHYYTVGTTGTESAANFTIDNNSSCNVNLTVDYDATGYDTNVTSYTVTPTSNFKRYGGTSTQTPAVTVLHETTNTQILGTTEMGYYRIDKDEPTHVIVDGDNQKAEFSLPLTKVGINRYENTITNGKLGTVTLNFAAVASDKFTEYRVAP